MYEIYCVFMLFRVDARFHSTPLKDNKGLQKPDPKKLESVLRTKTLKISQKAGGEKAANHKRNHRVSGRQTRSWNLRILGFPQEGARAIGNEAIIRSVAEESIPERPTSPAG